MKRLIAWLLVITTLVFCGYADDSAPTVQFKLGFKAGANLYDQDKNVSMTDDTYVTGGLEVDKNGTGIALGSTTLLNTGYDGSVNIPGAKWEQLIVYTTMWDGLLYAAVGANEVRDFVTSFQIGGSELVGNPMGKGTSALMNDNPYGVFVKSNPFTGLNLGAFMPIAERTVTSGNQVFSAINDEDGVADPSFKNAFDMTEFAASYDIYGIGTVYAGYLPYVKKAYGAASLRFKQLPTLSVGLGLGYNWEEDLGGMEVAPGFYYYYAAPVVPSTDISATATYTIGRNIMFAADAKYTILPEFKDDTFQNGGTPEATAFYGALRGKYTIVKYVAVQMDASMKYNSEPEAFWNDKEIYSVIYKPQLVLTNEGTNAVLNIGYQYNQITKDWSIPLSVSASF